MDENGSINPFNTQVCDMIKCPHADTMNKKMQVPFVFDWQVLRWDNSISCGLMTVNLLEEPNYHFA